MCEITFLVVPLACARLQRNSVVFLKSAILYIKSKSFLGIFRRISSTVVMGFSHESGLTMFRTRLDVLLFSSSKMMQGQSMILILLTTSICIASASYLFVLVRLILDFFNLVLLVFNRNIFKIASLFKSRIYELRREDLPMLGYPMMLTVNVFLEPVAFCASYSNNSSNSSASFEFDVLIKSTLFAVDFFDTFTGWNFSLPYSV